MEAYKTLNVVAPCYNEELNINEYLTRVLKTLEKLKIEQDFQIIMNKLNIFNKHSISKNKIQKRSLK
jgi:hypothetical protein